MSKFLAKVIKKGALLSIILAAIVVVAGVIGILFGVNDTANVSSGKKVVVTIDPVLYNMETAKNDIVATCDDAFKGYLYDLEGDNGNNGALIYAFKSNADVSKAVEELQATFDSWTADGGKYATYSLTVSVNNENVLARFAEGYLVRAVIASAVLVVLAFAYVALRYNWRMGVVAAISVAASIFLTSAIVVLTRIPTSASIVYAVVISALVSAITVLFNLNKLRAALKNDNAEQDTEKLIVSSVAVKEIIIFTAILGAAVLLVGLPAGASAAWFALCSFIGVAVAAFVGLIYTPALCLPMQNAIAAKEASATKYGYKGAKKGEKPAPKAEPKKEEVKEEPAPVEKVEETEETKADEE